MAPSSFGAALVLELINSGEIIRKNIVTYDLARVVVVGTSGSGKTTFARRLATILDVPHIELDALFWGPDWTPRDHDAFRTTVEQATAKERWVLDGNYHVVRDIAWPRAITVIWHNYSFSLVFWRVFWRTMQRLTRRQKLFAGNRESFWMTFLSKESLLWWVTTTYARRRTEFGTLRQENVFPNLLWLEFQRPSQAEEFLRSISIAAAEY